MLEEWHPCTVINLALSYWVQKRWDEAIALQERVGRDRCDGAERSAPDNDHGEDKSQGDEREVGIQWLEL